MSKPENSLTAVAERTDATGMNSFFTTEGVVLNGAVEGIDAKDRYLFQDQRDED